MSALPKIRFLDRSTPPHIFTLTVIAAMSAVNMSIFLPSLAKMTEDFGTDYAVMQFAVSGYLLATAILQIIVGPLSDSYGRRPVVIGSLLIFAAATVGCAMAQTVGGFLAYRAVQAVVATGMVLSRAVVRDIVPGAQAASMIGYVTMGAALVPMLGPTLGGFIDGAFGWRAIFWMMSVLALLVALLSFADQGETLATGGLSLRAQIRNYPELFTSQRFWGYVLCTAFGSGAFFALLGGASYVAQQIFGLSTTVTGIAIGAPAIGYVVGNFLSGRFATRLGINRMAMIGSCISAGGLGLSVIVALVLPPHPLLFFGLVVPLGLGNGIALPSATAGSLSVRPELAGTASGLGGAIMIGGGAALSALAGAWLAGESTPMVLQLLMFASSVGAVVSMLWVMRRERALGRQ